MTTDKPKQWHERLLPSVLACALFLVLAGVAVHSFYWWGPAWWKVLGTFDSHRQFGPRAFFADYWMHQGVFPLWNPLVLCGVPICANPEASLFYPINLLRSVLTPGPTPLNTHVSLMLMNAFHLLVAGCGTFLLGRRHRLSFAASVLAALAFVFCCGMTRRIPEHFNIVGVVAWTPWILLLVRMGAESPVFARRCAYGVGAGLVYGLSTLAGHTDYTIYIGLLVAAYLFTNALWDHGRSGFPALAKALAQESGLLVLVGVIAVAIALPLVLTGAELAEFSGRSADSGYTVHKIEVLDKSWQGAPAYRSPWYLLQCHVLFAGPNGRGSELRGSGVITLLLAIAALTRIRRKEVALFLVLYLVLFDISLEAPVSLGRLLRAVSPYQIGFPFRAALLIPLPLALLAGIGLDTLVASFAEKGRRSWAPLLALGTAGVVSLLVLGVYCLRQNPMGISPSAVLPPLALLGVVVLGLWRNIGQVCCWAIPLLFVAEAALWTPPYTHRFYHRPGSRYELAPESLSHEREVVPSKSRGIQRVGNWGLYDLDANMNGYCPLHIRAAAEFLHGPKRKKGFTRGVDANEPTAEQHRGNLLLKRRFWLAHAYAAGPTPEKDALFPPTQTAFVTAPHPQHVPKTDAMEDSSVPQQLSGQEIPLDAKLREPVPFAGKSGAWIELNLPARSLPIQHGELEVECAVSSPITLRVTFADLDSGRSSPGKTYGLLPEAPCTLKYPLPDYSTMRCVFHVNGQDSDASGEFRLDGLTLRTDTTDEDNLIRIIREDANQVDIEVGPLPGPRLLSYLDAAYPGWRVYVNGEPHPLLTTFDVFKGVELPEGTHRVRFVFRPWRVYAGLAGALATLFGYLAGLVWLSAKKWRQ